MVQLRFQTVQLQIICTVYEGLCMCGVARQFCIHNVTFSEGKYNTIHKLEM